MRAVFSHASFGLIEQHDFVGPVVVIAIDKAIKARPLRPVADGEQIFVNHAQTLAVLHPGSKIDRLVVGAVAVGVSEGQERRRGLIAISASGSKLARDNQPAAVAPGHRDERPDQLFLGDTLDLKTRRKLKAIEVAEVEDDFLPRRIAMRADHFDWFPFRVVKAGLEPAFSLWSVASGLPIGAGVARNLVSPLPADFGVHEQTSLARSVRRFNGEHVRAAANDAVQVEQVTFPAVPLTDFLSIHPQHELVVASDDRRTG